MIARYFQPLSSIVWNNVAVTANTTSPSLRIWNCPWLTIFGTVSAATTITLMVSSDGVNFYAGPTQVISAAGGFVFNVQVGCEWVALQSNTAVTATAIISAK